LDRDADSLDIAAKNQAERKSVEEHYRQIEESAKASGRVLVGIEQQKDADLEQLRKKQSMDAAQRGYEEGQKQLQAYRSIMDSKAAMLTAAAGDNVLLQQRTQAEIERIEIGYHLRQYQATAAHFQNIASLYPENTQQYREALGQMSASHKAYLDSSTAAYRKYSEEIKSIDQQIRDLESLFRKR